MQSLLQRAQDNAAAERKKAAAEAKAEAERQVVVEDLGQNVIGYMNVALKNHPNLVKEQSQLVIRFTQMDELKIKVVSELKFEIVREGLTRSANESEMLDAVIDFLSLRR